MGHDEHLGAGLSIFLVGLSVVLPVIQFHGGRLLGHGALQNLIGEPSGLPVDFWINGFHGHLDSTLIPPGAVVAKPARGNDNQRLYAA